MAQDNPIESHAKIICKKCGKKHELIPSTGAITYWCGGVLYNLKAGDDVEIDEIKKGEIMDKEKINNNGIIGRNQLKAILSILCILVVFNIGINGTNISDIARLIVNAIGIIGMFWVLTRNQKSEKNIQ